jgi:mono/diheme cytochrome c family protein
MSRTTVFVMAGALALAASELMVWSSAPSARALPGIDTTAALSALGDSIFHGKAANGICFTCHQPNARGLKGVAPDLTDAKWLHGDGTVEAIMATIEKGVPKPKESPVPMPPWGGAKLTPAQLLAVATYVKSLGPK